MRRFWLLLAGLAFGAWGLWTIGTSTASAPLGAAGTPLFLPLVVQQVRAAETPTPTATPTLTATPSATATGTGTSTATVSPTNTPTLTPSSTASATDTPTLTPSSTPTLTPSSTASPTSTPTASATTTPTTPVDTPTATATGTHTPTPTPTRTPTTTGTYTSIDLVVVIDISSRMALGAAKGDPLRDPAVCNTATPTPDNPRGGCYPFTYAMDAAAFFADEAFADHDRLSVVTFDREASVLVPLTNTLSLQDLRATVYSMQVLQSHDPGHDADCHFQRYATDGTGSDPNTDPSNCTGASVGAGLRLAAQQFQTAPARPGAQRVVILISGGAANASELDPDTGSLNRYCPPTDWSDTSSDPSHYAPFCRDFDPTTRHTLLDPTVYGLTHTAPYNPNNSYAPSLYDADDYARDNADRLACPAALADAPAWCRDGIDYPGGDGGQGATLYSIGVGELMVLDPKAGGVADLAALNGEARIDPGDPRAGYAAGDALLRYIANVGADGNPDPSVGPDECQGVPPPALTAQPDPALPTLPDGDLSYACGNYYFANAGMDIYSISGVLGLRLWHALLIPPTITPTPWG